VDAAPLWQKLLEGKDYVNLVQIGACDGDFGSTSSNDPVQHFMMNEPKIRALLVEASPSTYETLRRKVADLHEDRLRTVNAAVAPFLQEKVPFYVVSKHFQEDYPRKAFHWAMWQLNSMDRDHVLKHHVHLGLTEEEFNPYILEIQVDCKTPAILLEEVDLSPKEVNILAIDAEGLDVQILQAFLKLPGFDPSMIFCEVAHVDPDIFHDLRCSLETRGYHLGRVGSEMTEDGLGDLLAWKVG